MNPTERLDILRRGFDAVGMITAGLVERFGEQPDDPTIGRLLGNVHGVFSRLAFVFASDGASVDAPTVEARDGSIYLFALDQEDEILAQCEELLQQAGPYRGESPALDDTEALLAIQALRSLLRRYAAGEFVPV